MGSATHEVDHGGPLRNILTNDHGGPLGNITTKASWEDLKNIPTKNHEGPIRNILTRDPEGLENIEINNLGRNYRKYSNQELSETSRVKTFKLTIVKRVCSVRHPQKQRKNV